MKSIRLYDFLYNIAKKGKKTVIVIPDIDEKKYYFDTGRVSDVEFIGGIDDKRNILKIENNGYDILIYGNFYDESKENFESLRCNDHMIYYRYK